MTARRQRDAGDDSGQVLILALVFIFAIVTVVGATLTFAATSMNSYNHLHDTQVARYSGEGAVEQLIVAEQTDNSNAACTNTPISVGTGTAKAYATCKVLPTTVLPLQRDVLFCAYASQPAIGNCTGSKILLRAEVFFQDTLSSGGPVLQGEKIVSWAYDQN